jgi:hypothetical protein
MDAEENQPGMCDCRGDECRKIRCWLGTWYSGIEMKKNIYCLYIASTVSITPLFIMGNDGARRMSLPRCTSRNRLRE